MRTAVYSRARVLATCLLMALFCPAGTAWAQAAPGGAAGPDLERHYDAAQRFQQAGKLDEAGEEYRLFVSGALSQLALGEARLGGYAKAAALFENALTLEPGSSSVRMSYAQASLDAGAMEQAEKLARQILAEEHGTSKDLAATHEILGRTLLRTNRDREARKELEAANSMDPTFDHGYNLAVACLDLDDADCATHIFAELEKSYGDTPEIHMDFGRAWGESDFQPRAEEEFKKVIAENPRFPEAHYCLAATYLQENESTKIPAAKAELEKELTVSPRDFLTLAALGKLAATQQRYAEAKRYLERAIQLNGKSPDAYLYLGQMYFDMNRPAEAESRLREAVRLTKDPSRNHYQIQKAHFLLGRILMRDGKREEASLEMKLAQSLQQQNFVQDRDKTAALLGTAGPGKGASESGLALVETPGKRQQGADPTAMKRVELYRQQIAPAIADSYNNLGAIAAVKKDYSRALSNFQSAAQWNPSLEGIDLNWGRAAFMASKFEDAIAPLTRYLDAHPKDGNIRAVLGISEFMTGNFRACLTVLRPVEAELDSIPQIAYVFAVSLVKTGRTAEGMARLSELEKSHPEVPDVHRALGESLEQQGETQKASDELQQALRLNKDDAAAHFDLGQLWLKNGNAAGAVPELETAVRLAPAQEKYHETLAHAYRLTSRSADEEKELQAYQRLHAQHALSPGSPTAETGSAIH